MTMDVLINGRSEKLDQGVSLRRLLDSLGLKADRCAIELNRQLVPRAAWEETLLAEKDEVEIVHFVGGG